MVAINDGSPRRAVRRSERAVGGAVPLQRNLAEPLCVDVDPAGSRESVRPARRTDPAQPATSRRRASGTPGRPYGLPTQIRWEVVSFAAIVFGVVAGSRPQWLPWVSVAVWLLVGLTVLRSWYLLLDTAVVGAAVLAATSLRAGPQVPHGLTLGLVLLGAVLLGQGRMRRRNGRAAGIADPDRADAVIVDLRDRARSQGDLPALPAGWDVEADLRPAAGGTFGGDFLLATRRSEGQLELVLVDVSGSGDLAGGRALLFSGAFGALLDELPYEGFLPAANRYLLRHGGEEGFASALHARVDLTDGSFRVMAAGHPPAAHYQAGSGRWAMLTGEHGPLLGVLADAQFPSLTGRLDRGDALLLYTDGMVESRRVDVDRGIDRLIGRAEPVLLRGGSGGAATIAADERLGVADDRAVVVVRRSG